MRRMSAAIAVALLLAAAPIRAEEAVPHSSTQGVAAVNDDWLFDDSAADEPLGGIDVDDPLENANRVTFGFNEHFYHWVADPVSKAFAFVVPDPARRMIRRFFDNLEEPVTFANDVLQLAPRRAGHTLGRFVVNTTVGLGGLFDPATHLGLESEDTDFGETLAIYGTPRGVYLVIPVLGPSTARDAVGELVDSLMRPDTWLLGTTTQIFMTTGSGLATYDIERDRLDALRETSVDFYASLRGAYLLDRQAHLTQRRALIGWGGSDAGTEPQVAGGAGSDVSAPPAHATAHAAPVPDDGSPGVEPATRPAAPAAPGPSDPSDPSARAPSSGP